MAAPAASGQRGRARRRAWIVAGVLGALFLANAVWIVRGLRGLGGGAPTVGHPAPLFRGATLDGPPLALADLRGKVVLLDFWATWCAPCLAELPALRQLAESRGPRGLAVVGVNIEGASARRAVADVVHEAGLHHPTVIDDGEIRQLYRVEGLPHLVIVDRGGIVRQVFRGTTSVDELARAVDESLSPAAGH